MAARLLGGLFVLILLGFAVFSAVLFDNDGTRAAGPVPADPLEPAPEGTRSPATPREAATPRMSGRYPKACLRPVSRPRSFGLVAAYRSGTITITDTDGVVRATIRAPKVVRPPLAWSPSGRILAAGPQGLFWRPDGSIVLIGDVQHGLVQGRRGRWGWSPLSDCGVHLDGGGALLVTAANPYVVGAGRELIGGGVESFSYSSDGRQLGLVLEVGGRRSIWIADLVTNRLERVMGFPEGTCCISLAGWTPSGDDLLFWAGPGASVMADGWPLTTAGDKGRPEEWGVTIPGGPLARCGGDLVGLVGGDRFGEGADLAVLVPGQRDRSLTREDDIASFACSPDNNFFVAQSDDSLVLLGDDGSFIRFLTDVDTPNGRWSERSPEWGPPRTGILFLRSMHLQTQLWFLAEGQRTGRPIAQLELTGKVADRSLFDWSATPPSGLPAG